MKGKKKNEGHETLVFFFFKFLLMWQYMWQFMWQKNNILFVR